jgi:hypothetical protein
MNWSPQKPTRKAIERDEEGIGQWVKQEWPAIKKASRLKASGAQKGRPLQSARPIVE